MTDLTSDAGAWVYRATIEILKRVDEPNVIGDGARGFQLRPARYSPKGRQRLDLFVDKTLGAERAQEVAQHMLSAMSGAAAAGRIRGFKIVNDGALEQPSADRQAAG